MTCRIYVSIATPPSFMIHAVCVYWNAHGTWKIMNLYMSTKFTQWNPMSRLQLWAHHGRLAIFWKCVYILLCDNLVCIIVFCNHVYFLCLCKFSINVKPMHCFYFIIGIKELNYVEVVNIYIKFNLIVAFVIFALKWS